MSKLQRFVFLNSAFYNDFPADDFEEILHKPDRPYIQIQIIVGGIRFALPLRSNINHPFAYITNKTDNSGIDFTKAVVIDDTYIDTSRIPHIRSNEFKALRGKDYTIGQRFLKYIYEYNTAKEDLTIDRNKQLYNCSTLKYFDQQVGNIRKENQE